MRNGKQHRRHKQTATHKHKHTDSKRAVPECLAETQLRDRTYRTSAEHNRLTCRDTLTRIRCCQLRKASSPSAWAACRWDMFIHLSAAATPHSNVLRCTLPSRTAELHWPPPPENRHWPRTRRLTPSTPTVVEPCAGPSDGKSESTWRMQSESHVGPGVCFSWDGGLRRWLES